MSDELDRFAYQSLQDCNTIVEHLRAVADGIAQGELTLASEGRELVLHPRDMLHVRLRAARGSHRSRLVLKLSWRERAPAEPAKRLEVRGPAVAPPPAGEDAPRGDSPAERSPHRAEE